MSLLDDVSIVVTPNGYKAGELYAVKPTFALGSELVTNGDFTTDTDWTKGIGWTISGNAANFTYSTPSSLIQDLTVTSGLRYLIEYEIVSNSGVSLKGGGNSFFNVGSSIPTTVGLHSFYVTAVNSSGIDFRYLSGSGSLSVTNISVKEYTSADMDVTRATAATRVDENGLVNYAEVVGGDLVQDGDFLLTDTQAENVTGTYWTTGTGWSIGSGLASCDGTQTGSSNLTQNINITTVNKLFKIKFSVTNFQSGRLNLYVGGINFFESSGNGNFEGYVNVTNASSDTNIYLNANSLFEGSVTNISVKEVTRDNVPRIDYTGGGCPHILAEPQRTNLITYSEAFDNVYWTKSGASVTSGFTSPDGTDNAFKLVEDTSNGVHRIGKATFTANVERTLTVFAKKGERDYISLFENNTTSPSVKGVIFNLNNGTYYNNNDTYYTNVKIELISNGWYRCSATMTNGGLQVPSFGVSADGLTNSYQGDGTSGVYIYGASLEEGSYPTSYIPTSGSTVTRNQDIFTRDGIGSLINSTEGVLFVEMAALSNDSTYRGISLNKNDGTANNRIVIFFWNASNELLIRSTINGVTKINETINLVSETDYNKIAISYKLNNWKIYVNGSLEAAITNASALVFPSGTLDNLSFDSTLNSNPLYGKVKQLQVYDTALTDEQLLQLTGESGTDFYESYAEMASALTYTIQ